MHDAHCHIDLYPNFRKQLADIAAGKLATIAVTNTPSVFEMCERICAGNSFVHPAIGLHPELVGERERELPLLLQLIHRVRFIGEIGLDFTTRDPVARAAQIRVFTAIIAAARAAGGKTLTIHSRRAAAEVVEIVGPGFPGAIILHWFSGSANVLRRAVGYGYYFSVNPAMTRSSTGQSIIRSVPTDRLLMESDGPFVTIDNAPAKPADVRLVVEHVAALWNLSLVETERRLDRNFAIATSRSTKREQ